MYRILNIGGNEYKLEYSIEASLYSDCTKKVMDMMMNIETAQTDSDIRALIDGMADLPQTALTMFHAGLLEHHGPDADGTIMSIKDTKKIAVQYLKESDEHNWSSLLSICTDQMGDDGFFKLIGLNPEEQTEQKPVKMPQDHKKPAKKRVSEN